jgi:lipopolysaccharide export system protein LptC
MTLGYHVHWPPLVLALILAALGFWLNQVAVRPQIFDDSGFVHEPDYIVEQFNALSFDTQGKPLHRLRAARMAHYMDDDTTVLELPVFTSLDPLLPVEVKSQRAQISADGRQVYFLRQVRLERLGLEGQMPVTLETEYLQVTPDERIMRSNQLVTFRQGASVITASQFMADDKKRLMTLSGGVKAVIERTP